MALNSGVEWLAGILDGEGAFRFVIAPTNEERRHFLSFYPLIRLELTKGNGLWIDKTKSILLNNQIGFRFCPNEKAGFPYFIVENYINVIKLVNLVLPYLTVKRDQALLYLKAPTSTKRSCLALDGKYYVFKEAIEEWVNYLALFKSYNSKKSGQLKWSSGAIRDFYYKYPNAIVLDSPKRLRPLPSR